MSDTARPKSAGDKLAADEINRDLPITLTGGETIAVSPPKAVYLKASDGEVYQCDANAGHESTYAFIGFLVEATSDGNDAVVQTHGKVGGFTGLTAGSIYYLSDTAGTISTTRGTYEKQVGIAVSTTELLIKTIEHWEYISSNSASVSTSGSISSVPTYCNFVIIHINDNLHNIYENRAEALISRYGKTSTTLEFGNEPTRRTSVISFDSSNNEIDYTESGDLGVDYELAVYYYT